MNLSNSLSNEYAKSMEKRKEYIDKVATDIVMHINAESMKRAADCFCTYSGYFYSVELDKLDSMNEGLKKWLKQAIADTVNAKIKSKEFVHTHNHIIAKQNNRSRSRTRMRIFLAWQKRISCKPMPESNLKVNCPICMETKSAVSLTPCGHLFCLDCSPKLFAKLCPVCRTHCTGMHNVYQP